MTLDARDAKTMAVVGLPLVPTAQCGSNNAVHRLAPGTGLLEGGARVPRTMCGLHIGPAWVLRHGALSAITCPVCR